MMRGPARVGGAKGTLCEKHEGRSYIWLSAGGGPAAGGRPNSRNSRLISIFLRPKSSRPCSSQYFRLAGPAQPRPRSASSCRQILAAASSAESSSVPAIGGLQLGTPPGEAPTPYNSTIIARGATVCSR